MKQSISSEKSEQNKLDKYFDEIRKENYEQTFSSSAGWLRSVYSNQSKNKSERIFSNMKNFFAQNKLRLAYTFLILAFVVAACNYPVTQEESAGDVMQWTVSKDNTDAISKIQNLDWFRNGQYNVNENNSNGKEYVTYSLVVPKEDHSKVKDYDKQLSAIDGVLEVKLSPLSETVKRPVYSAVLNDLFKLDINATNMSDEELSKEIDRQLKSAGIEASTVNFERDENGHRRVKVVVPVDQLKKDGGFDLTVHDGNNVNRFKEVKKEGPGGDRFKNKTDAEIRKMVREDVGDPNLTDDQIEIIRKGDNVMIKVNKTDSKVHDEIELEQK